MQPFSLNSNGDPTGAANIGTTFLISVSSTLKVFIALHMSAENAGVMRVGLHIFQIHFIYRLSFSLNN